MKYIYRGMKFLFRSSNKNSIFELFFFLSKLFSNLGKLVYKKTKGTRS